MEKKQTLLEKARAVSINKSWRGNEDELLDLALAWLRSEITYKQARFAMNKVSGEGAYAMIAASTRRAIARGDIEIRRTKGGE